MAAKTKRVCVYCGSSRGARPVYAEAAAEFGRLLAGAGLGLVTGGGRVGLMGAVANAALEAGGEVVGVIPEHLKERELGHGGLSELLVVPDMHARKATMAALSDAFVALPGGTGTLEELFEAITWSQLGLHAKPVALLDTDGYWGGLLTLFSQMEAEGFARADGRARPLVETEPAALVARLLELLDGATP